MKNAWWLLVSKKEMTRLWAWDQLVCVTLVQIIPQIFYRLKTTEKDWYNAVVVAYSIKWDVSTDQYHWLAEYRIDESKVSDYQSLQMWDQLPVNTLQADSTISITSVSKWKWFQWPVKRCWAKGMPATHWHKFTRVLGSMGNRKPRRTMKWHPAAWRMWTETVTLKNLSVVHQFEKDWIVYAAIKWSLPGWRNNIMKAYFSI